MVLWDDYDKNDEFQSGVCEVYQDTVGERWEMEIDIWYISVFKIL